MIFLDIETIPLGKPDPESVKVPKNYKDPEKIETYKQEHAEEHWRQGSVDGAGLRGRPIVIGFAADDMQPYALYNEDERLLLEQLHRGLVKYKGYPFCTFNGADFDLKFLIRRAFANDLPELTKVLVTDMQRKPWDRHNIDLRHAWGLGKTFGARGTLDEICELAGIARPDNPIDGKDVLDRYLAGDIEAIRQHCRDDVRVTRELYWKMYEHGMVS